MELHSPYLRRQKKLLVSFFIICSLNTTVPLLDRSALFIHDIVVTKEVVTKLLRDLNQSL